MSHLPVRERIAAGIPGRKDQFAHAPAAAVKAFEQARERVPVVLVPLGRNALGFFAEHRLRNAVFQAMEPGLERVQAYNGFIHAMARIQSAQRSIWKIPFTRVEAKPVIDHHCSITGPIEKLTGTWAGAVFRLPKENRLPPVRVARPFVENESTQKVRKIAP